MAQNVTWSGVSYSVPDPNDTGWGPQLTAYLVALPAGALQKTGGAFTLLADADFGANFGLKSKYFKSNSSGIAATGVVRLANAESVVWRNALNNADLALTVSAGNALQFNAANVITAGTEMIVNADISASAAIAYSKMAALSTSRALVSNGSGVVTVATTTATEIGYVNGVTSAIQTQINAKAPTASPTFTGTVTAPNLAITNTSNQFVLGATRTVTLTAPTPASASRTVTIPDLSGDYSLIGSIGDQSMSGVKTFTGNIAIADGSAGVATGGIYFTSDTNTGIYRRGADQIGLITGGANGVFFGAATTSDGTDQTSMAFNCGSNGTQTTFRNRATANVTNSATTVATISQFCDLVLVTGTDGSNVFGDLVFAAFGVATPVVIAARTSGASARTYTQSSGNLQLAMASGTYDVTTLIIEQRTGSF